MLEAESKIDVALWSARIPGLLRFAEHHWFVVTRPGTVDRWEVWQSPNQCDSAWGHLHLNLLQPSAGVGNGPGYRLQRWTGDKAIALAARIEASPLSYPWVSKYLVFPGPNSNTFVQWILADDHQLGWRGFGRGYAVRSHLMSKPPHQS